MRRMVLYSHYSVYNDTAPRQVILLYLPRLALAVAIMGLEAQHGSELTYFESPACLPTL